MATETVTLNIGKHEVVFYPNSHQYKVNKENIPSVSRISWQFDKSWALMMWAESLVKEACEANIWRKLDADLAYTISSSFRKEKDAAADIGTQVHKAIEEYLVDGKPLQSDNMKVQNGIIWFLKWYKKDTMKFIHNEIILYSDTHKYIWTCDAIMDMDGKRYVVDFKTSKQAYLDHYVQACGYAIAYEEMEGKSIDGIIILSFNKEDWSFKQYICEDLDVYKETFLTLRKIYDVNKLFNKQLKWKN